MTILTITPIDSDPLVTEFVSLQDYRSSTPASFSLEESPVLHCSANALTLESPHLYTLLSLPTPPPLAPGSLGPTPASGPVSSETRTQVQQKCGVEGSKFDVNVKIASSRLFLWFPKESFGFAIPYTSITLHGITRASVLYLQLAVPPPSSSISTPNESDSSSPEFIELWINTEDAPQCHEMYAALGDCANLHLDPSESDDDNETGINQQQAFALDMMDLDIDLGNFQGALGVSMEDDEDRGGRSEFAVRNNGNADDLSDMEDDIDKAEEDEEGEDGSKANGLGGYASLEIQLKEEQAARAGTRRTREEDDETSEGKQNGMKANVAVGSEVTAEGTGKWRRVS